MNPRPASLLFFCMIPLLFGQGLDRSGATAELERANRIVETLHVSEVLGPLAPVALSPFFGITCLSGMAILNQRGILPENQFIGGNKTLSNHAIFGAFLILTLITSLPKFSKVSKPLGQAIDQLETYAGILAYVVILMIPQYFPAQPGEQTAQVMVTAGFATMPLETLLIIVAALNIFVINTVKFLFEILIFVCPIPTVDALFELLNKAVCAGLMLIYSLNPMVAFVFNILLFLISLTLFAWARRWVVYFREISIMPLLSRLFGGSKNAADGLKRSRIPPQLRKHLTDDTRVIKVFPLQKQGKIRKRACCYLLIEKDLCKLARVQLGKGVDIRMYPPETWKATVQANLLSNSFSLQQGETRLQRFVFSRLYDTLIVSIADVYQVSVPQRTYADLPFGRALKAMLSGNKQSLKSEMT
ncbi:MAG: hypothetical protein ACI9TH_002516 [Kiritimatiellia bacterium]|jgi:hypothetical protein